MIRKNKKHLFKTNVTHFIHQCKNISKTQTVTKNLMKQTVCENFKSRNVNSFPECQFSLCIDEGKDEQSYAQLKVEM